MVRRDRADFFCTIEEGVKGKRAVDWRLVDEVVPRTRLADEVRARAEGFAAKSDRPAGAKGIALTPLSRRIEGDRIAYSHVEAKIDRDKGIAEISIAGPKQAPPASAEAIQAQGDQFWSLALARELDDLILHLRTNEETVGMWVFRTHGDADLVSAYDAALEQHKAHWLVREIRLFLKRVLKRIDVSSRSIFALIEPGSCFTGTLLELALAADRSYMLDGTFEGDNRPAATIRMTAMNFGPYPMSNGLSRIASRNLDNPAHADDLKNLAGSDLDAEAADAAGLVTFTPDDIDWEDEVRIAIEERAAYSPDALTGMEASLRFGGPETMETKIFGRLTAWQNWIFQRPNAVGDQGALKLYGTGQRAAYDRKRV
jgi:benzoyl-CoA-dihydrodiol lyase